MKNLHFLNQGNLILHSCFFLNAFGKNIFSMPVFKILIHILAKHKLKTTHFLLKSWV